MMIKRIIKSCSYSIITEDNKFNCIEGYLIPEKYNEKSQFIKRCPNCNVKGERDGQET